MNLFIALAAAIGVLLGAALGDLVSGEVRGQLDRVPVSLLKIARRRLPESMRVRLHDEEWLPELLYILSGEETRPISRLLIGTRYSLGLVRRAHTIASILDTKAMSTTSRERWVATVDVLRMTADLSVVVAGIIASGTMGVLLGRLVPHLLSIDSVNGPKLGVILGSILTATFGALLGTCLTLILSSGLGRMTRRLLITRLDRNESPAQDRVQPTRREKFQSVLDRMTGSQRDNKWGLRVSTFAGSLTGVGVGIIFGSSFQDAWQPVTIGTACVGVLVLLRIPLVNIPKWVDNRKHKGSHTPKD